MASNFIVPLSERQGLGYDALKFLYSAKGFAQASKTVGNNITHERNLQSSGLIMLSNGLNPFSSKTYKAVQTAWSAVKPTDNKAVNDLYNEYLRLGITNQNAKLGDIKRLIAESQNNVTGTFIDKIASKTGLSYLGRQVEKAYVAEDDLWKIAVYENELSFLKKAYPKEQLEKLKLEASRITRNTMPTYDMIPSGFKLLRYSPFGNYFAFHAERFRNTFHNYKQAINEIKSGNDILKQRGWKRLSGQITIGQTGNLIVAGSSMYHTGVSKEEDGHIKNIFKQSYHGNNWLYDVQDKSGKLLFADTKYTDPSAPINDVILTPMLEYLNTDKMTEAEFEDRFFKAASTAYGNFVAPFIDTTILFDAVQDVFTRNGQVEGANGELYDLEGWDSTTDNAETYWNNFIIGANHIVKTAFLPVAVDNVANTIKINKEQPDKYGVVKDPDLNRFKNLAGINYKVIDNSTILKSISQKSRGFSSKTSAIQRKDLYKYDGESNVTIAKLKHQYLQANKKHYLNFTDLKRSINSAIELSNINPERYSLTINDIEKTLRNSNMSADNIKQLTLTDKRDIFIPLKMSEEKIDNIIRMNPTINRFELETELRNLKNELMNLPLLDIRDEYTESQTKALNILYQRKPFFEGGGVSEDYPVSDVTSIPADRKNPDTKLPYSDQIARLGLQEGGIPKDAVRIYDEDQGLKPVMPIIELFSGVGLMKSGRVIKEVGEEIIEKKAVPKILYHGSPTRNLKELIPSKNLPDKVYNQPGIFSNPLKENTVKFTGNKGAVYALDTSNVSSFKNMLNISKNKVLNADKPNSSIIRALDKQIRKYEMTSKTGLLKQDNLNLSRQLKSFKRDLLDKDNYISGLGPAATNFLTKQNVDIIKSTPNFRNPNKIPNYILLKDKIPVKDELLTKLKNNKYYIQVD